LYAVYGLRLLDKMETQNAERNIQLRDQANRIEEQVRNKTLDVVKKCMLGVQNKTQATPEQYLMKQSKKQMGG
jgi:hypothetical protein